MSALQVQPMPEGDLHEFSAGVILLRHHPQEVGGGAGGSAACLAQSQRPPHEDTDGLARLARLATLRGVGEGPHRDG